MVDIGIVSGIGKGEPIAWDVSEFKNILSVTGIKNQICVSFDLSSKSDIEHKFNIIKGFVDRGECSENDFLELREIVRTRNGLSAGGSGERTIVGIGESRKTVYRDGKPVIVEMRKKLLIPTPNQKKAAENARKYAHTPEADAKRRKSLLARRDGKVLGEI